MPFTIPNPADAAVTGQAEVDSRDLDVIVDGAAVSGVQLGAYTDCAVTASTGLTLAVAAGTVRVRGYRTVVTAGTVTLAAANATNARYDLVVATKATGVKTSIAGTAAATPVFPAWDRDLYVVLAAVYVAANDTTIASGEITDKRMFVQNPGCEHVDWYGAVGTTDGTVPSVNASPAIIAAEAALPTNGGTVVFGPKFYALSASVGPTKDDVRFVGQGLESTRLYRLGDIIILDVIGAHATTTTTLKRSRFQLQQMTLHGTSNTYVQPMSRWMYTAENKVSLCNFLGGGGRHVDSTEFWDTVFSECRFQDAVGTVPSVHIRSSTGAGTGLGHSTGDSNNIWLRDCTWESNTGGDVTFEGRVGADGPVNKCRISNAKLETMTIGAPSVKVDEAYDIDLQWLQITWGTTFRSGVATAQNMVEISNTMESRILGISGEAGGATGATIRTVVQFGNANQDITWDGINGAWQPAFSPTVALIEYAGSNIRVKQGGHGHNEATPGTTPLVVSWPTGITSTLTQPLDQPSVRMRIADITSTSTTITDCGSTWTFGTVDVGYYLMELAGSWQSSTTGTGPRFGVGGTATAGAIDGVLTMWQSLTGAPITTLMSAFNTTYGSAVPDAANASRQFGFRVGFQITARGSLSVKWLQSGASTGTVKFGSVARLTRVG